MKTMRWSYPNFIYVVKNSFESKLPLTEAISHFESLLKTWKRDIFYNIFHLKKYFLVRLIGIQRSPSYPHSYYLKDLERSLTKEFGTILRHEQGFWRLKSIINWLNDGDTSNKFFYTSTFNKRRKNRMTFLKEDNKKWHYSTEAINSILLHQSV